MVPIINVIIAAWLMQKHVNGNSRTRVATIVEANAKRVFVNISLLECILVIAPCSAV